LIDYPAILGGTPIRKEGPPFWPIFDADIAEAVRFAVIDGSWGQYLGPHVPALELALRSYHDDRNVMVCASGTLATETVLRSLSFAIGDEVVLSAYDYEANFLSVHAAGAIPVLVDIDGTTGTIDSARIAEAISERTRAILVSHLHGGLCRMRQIREIADTHHLPIIEDAAQCPGATVDGRKAGTWGDFGILSFGGSKLLTAGRGGAILTPHADRFQRVKLQLSRGVQQWALLSEFQAVALLPQVTKLDQQNELRWRNVRRLDEKLEKIPGLRRFMNDTQDSPTFYKVGYWFDEASFGLSRERFVDAMRAEGIAFDVGFRALHIGRSPRRYRAVGTLHNAERAHREIVILHHPVLLGTEADIEEVVLAVEKMYRNALRLAE